MSGLSSLGTVICVICVAAAILSSLIPQKRTRRVLTFVIGLFLLSSLFGCIMTSVKDAQQLKPALHAGEIPSYSEKDMERAVIQRTADNLTHTLDELLRNEGIEARNIELTLKISDDGGIYASRVVIYIDEKNADRETQIERIVYGNLSKEPEIYVAGEELQGLAQ